MKKRVLICALALVLALASFAGCASDKPAVSVQSVSELTGYGAIGTFNICAGVVTAQNEVEVSKDETKIVKEVFVSAGDTVKAGQKLFAYDMDNIQLTIDKTKLEIEQLKNSLVTYDEQIRQLEKEKASAPSSEQLSYTVQIQSLQTDRKEAEYNITIKEKELESMAGDSGNGEVVSPIDGRVESVNENGETDQMGNPKPFIVLIEDGAYRVKGLVNETNMQDLYIGAEVIIRSRIDDAQTWTGIVETIDTEAAQNGNGGMGYYDYGYSDEYTSSSKFPFYITLDSTNGLLLGQHVYIEPNIGQEQGTDSFMLYADYLVEDEDGFFAWADDGGKLEKRSVTVGAFDDMMYMYEIVDGISLEDYIAYPEEGLTEGQPTVKQEAFSEMGDMYADEGFADDAYVDAGVAVMPAEPEMAY